MSVQSDVAVSLSKVGKRYRHKVALEDVTLDLPFGAVIGFVGPNGAGKSTLMRIIAGFSAPSTGEAVVLGSSLAERQRHPPLIGWMAEKPAFVEHAGAALNLSMLAAIRGEVSAPEIDATLREVGLDPRNRRAVRGYSQGMRQRLSLAQAVMERPRLLLLDEPANGLDPHGLVLLRRMVRRLADEGACVVLSSHLLSEIAAVADRIVLIDGGRVRQEFDSCDAAWLERHYLSNVGEAIA